MKVILFNLFYKVLPTKPQISLNYFNPLFEILPPPFLPPSLSSKNLFIPQHSYTDNLVRRIKIKISLRKPNMYYLSK